MEQEIKLMKMRFNKALEPIKVMLVSRMLTLSHPDWLHFVEQTKASIIHHPDQYLGEENLQPETLAEVVNKIFQDFMEDLSMRGSFAKNRFMEPRI